MIAVRTAFYRLRTDQRGATAIEYGLIAALIAIALMSGITALGGGAGGMWTELAATVQTYM